MYWLKHTARCTTYAAQVGLAPVLRSWSRWRCWSGLRCAARWAGTHACAVRGQTHAQLLGCIQGLASGSILAALQRSGRWKPLRAAENFAIETCAPRKTPWLLPKRSMARKRERPYHTGETRRMWRLNRCPFAFLWTIATKHTLSGLTASGATKEANSNCNCHRFNSRPRCASRALNNGTHSAWF